MLQLAKKIISQLFIRKNIVHNPIINVQKPGENTKENLVPQLGGCRVSNWQPQSLQLTTVEPAIGKRSYICRFTTLYIYQNHKNNKE